MRCLYRSLPLILLLSLSASAGEGRPRSEESPATGPALTAATQTPDLWFAISAIKKEAVDAWRAKEPWPRSQANFAQERRWALPASAVVRALMRKLHNEPAVDAYVRWQLLSFIEDLESVDAALVNRIAETAPKPLSQPVVREEWLAVSGPGSAFIAIARQTAYVRDLRPVVGDGVVGLNPEIGVVTSGVGLSTEGSTKTYRTVIRQANERLEEERAKVTQANEMIVAYRRELVERMPRAGGVQLAVMIKDTADRLAAGEPSTQEAVSELLAKTEGGVSDIPPRTRQMLIAWVTRLGEMRTTVHDSVAPGGHEKQALLYAHEMAVPKEQIETLVARLSEP